MVTVAHVYLSDSARSAAINTKKIASRTILRTFSDNYMVYFDNYSLLLLFTFPVLVQPGSVWYHDQHYYVGGADGHSEDGG